MPIPRSPDNATGAPRVLLRDKAHSAILTAIVDGTIAPGEKLNDQELAAWLGVSRTPVREALARLEAQGLVEASPGKQTIVTEIDPRLVSEAASVAAALHDQACREAFPRITDAHIQKMRSANASFALALDSGDPTIALAADDAFHGIIVSLADNRLLAELLDTVMPSLRRAEHARFGSIMGRESIDGHSAIIDAFARHDAAAAADAIRANWLTLHVDRP